MAFYIEKMIFHNRAPFKHLELNFKDKDIILLNAVNGGGKTTVLSHIADAFYELARCCFILWTLFIWHYMILRFIAFRRRVVAQ